MGKIFKRVNLKKEPLGLEQRHRTKNIAGEKGKKELRKGTKTAELLIGDNKYERNTKILLRPQLTKKTQTEGERKCGEP